MPETPSVWLLWNKRKGDFDQMQRLAVELGYPYQIKRLRFRGPKFAPLARFLLDPRSDPLEPPWPAIVICAEALPSVVAKHLKRQSRGAIKTVCIGRPAGATAEFDLVVTTPQFGVPPAANVVELTLPMTMKPGENAPPYGFEARRPLIAAVIGGSSPPDLLDGEAARDLVRSLSSYALQRGGSLAVVTSPRTGKGRNGPATLKALRDTIAPPHRLHEFGRGENVYSSLLAAADEIIVTSDSVSMISEAIATGKPVQVYMLPQVRSFQRKLVDVCYKHAVQRRPFWLYPISLAHDIGVFKSSVDRIGLFEHLAREGRLSLFSHTPPASQPQGEDVSFRRAVERVHALLSTPAASGQYGR